MDLKVYTKEEVLQPEGSQWVYVPNVIDIIPEMIDGVDDFSSIKNNVWTLEQLSRFAVVKIEDNKLYINSDQVRFEDDKLVLTIKVQQIYNAQIVEGKDELEQACSLSTIWQKGLDPLALEEGIRWSEVMLGEVNVVQLMNDITEAVQNVSTAVSVVFDTVEGKDGESYLVYKLRMVG